MIDLEVTVEEVLAGLAIGLRLFAVAVLVGAVLAHIDADRLQAQVARIAPRSALTCALAARLLPTLERDARAIAEAARLRGVVLADGRWAAGRGARRRWRRLLGSSLERGLDVAEAMTARGYGAGPRTRSPSAVRPRRAGRPGARRRPGGPCGGALALGLAPYSFYPTLDPLLEPGPVALAAASRRPRRAALVLRRLP